MTEAAITTDHLIKRYGELAAVDGLSFSVPRGQLLAVLGPNGAGKTTTLEMMEGFVAPTAGAVRVLGSDPRRGGRAWRARIGLVLQSTSLDPELTVRETLRLYRGPYPAPRPVREVLDLLDLGDDADARVGALSGGQRRRVDVAIGVIGRPEVLFLDEPTTGLDPEARRRAWEGIESLTAAGTTVVLTTHYIDEAERLADRLLVIAAGRIVADTTPERLRGDAGPSTLRYRLPDGVAAAALPVELASRLGADGRTLVVTGDAITAALRALVALADAHRLDLSAIEIGPPSLEDAYLRLIDDTAAADTDSAGAGTP